MSILRCSPLRLRPPGDPSARSTGTACSCRCWGPGDPAARGLVNILGALLSAGDGEARLQSPFISVRPQRGLQPLIYHLLAASLQPACYGAWFGLGFFFFFSGQGWKKSLAAPGQRATASRAGGSCRSIPACLPPARSRLLLRWSPCPGRARRWLLSVGPHGGRARRCQGETGAVLHFCPPPPPAGECEQSWESRSSSALRIFPAVPQGWSSLEPLLGPHPSSAGARLSPAPTLAGPAPLVFSSKH